MVESWLVVWTFLEICWLESHICIYFPVGIKLEQTCHVYVVKIVRSFYPFTLLILIQDKMLFLYNIVDNYMDIVRPTAWYPINFKCLVRGVLSTMSQRSTLLWTIFYPPFHVEHAIFISFISNLQFPTRFPNGLFEILKIILKLTLVFKGCKALYTVVQHKKKKNNKKNMAGTNFPLERISLCFDAVLKNALMGLDAYKSIQEQIIKKIQVVWRQQIFCFPIVEQCVFGHKRVPRLKPTVSRSWSTNL